MFADKNKQKKWPFGQRDFRERELDFRPCLNLKFVYLSNDMIFKHITYLCLS